MRLPIVATLLGVALTATACGASTVTVTSTTPARLPATTTETAKAHKEAVERACEKQELENGRSAHYTPATPVCLQRKRAIVAHDAAEEKRVNEAYAASPEGKRRAKHAAQEAEETARKARDGAPDAALFERVEREGEARRHKLEAEGDGVGLTAEDELTEACEEGARRKASWNVDTPLKCGEAAREWVERREAEG